MKRFLLILSEAELDYQEYLEQPLLKKEAEVVVVHTIAEGVQEVRKGGFTEIITDSFSKGDPQGPWRQVWHAAIDKGMGVTLFTGQLYPDVILNQFESELVRILPKNGFDKGEFIAERFPESHPKES